MTPSAKALPPIERDSAELFQALTQVSHAVSNAESLEQILHLASEQAAVLLGVTRSLVLLTDDAGGLRIRAHFGLEHPSIETFSGTFDERLISTLARVLGDGRPDRVLAVPLVVRGHVTGLVAVGTVDADKPSGPREAILTALADQVAAPLEIARLAAEIRESRLLADTAEQATGVGIFTWNMMTGVRTWSPEVYHLHGLDPSQPASHDAWQATVHPDDVARAMADDPVGWALSHDTTTGASAFREREYRVLLPYGAIRWIAVRTRVVPDDAGRPKQMLGVCFDITERKQVEEEIRASEERFRLATEALAGFLFDWDPATNRVERFGDMEAIVGFRPDEVPSDTVWWERRVHPDDLPSAIQAARTALDGDAAEYALEYRVRHRDGHYVDVADRVRIVRDESGRVTRVVGGTTDISERRRHERECEELLAETVRAMQLEHEARAAAEAAARQRDHVLDVVAHELGNPLSTVGVCARVLAVSGESSSETRVTADLIERSVASMHRLLRDLKDVASIETGRLALQLHAEAPAALLTAAAEMFAAEALTAGVELRTRAVPDIPAVSADAGRLLQVFGNLVGNALRYSASGDRITLHAERHPVGVRFAVEDTGTGITAEDLPHVFDRFWHNRRAAQKGSGLGLPIVRGIVEAHGGEVGVESTPGHGSLFSFTVPIA